MDVQKVACKYLRVSMSLVQLSIGVVCLYYMSMWVMACAWGLRHVPVLRNIVCNCP